VFGLIKPALESAGIRFEISPTNHPGHATEIAQSSSFDGFDALIVIGGDGYVSPGLL
jgi:diacylglycerol kinase family enzyme